MTNKEGVVGARLKTTDSRKGIETSTSAVASTAQRRLKTTDSRKGIETSTLAPFSALVQRSEDD